MGRIRTLVLDANGWTRKAIAADTILRGVFGLSERVVPATWRSNSIIRKLLGQRYASMAYVGDWRDAIIRSPALEPEIVNINNLVAYRAARGRIRDYELVIVLHSAAGDSMELLRRTTDWFAGRRGLLAVFIGNEYDLLTEKIQFCRDAGAEFICSQLPIKSARWLYADATASQVLPMPHGLNERVYQPDAAVERNVDIGFIGDLYGYFIGDVERTALIDGVRRRCPVFGMTCDIRMGRVPSLEWVQFLNHAKGICGAESGTYYLDRTGTLIPAVLAFQRANPSATFADVYERFFHGRSIEFSGKAVSSRHFEPIGTLTCQLLVEGEYNGILRANEHYIPVRKDLADLDEAMTRFRDQGSRDTIARRAREYVLAEHTYAHRIAALVRAVGGS